MPGMQHGGAPAASPGMPMDHSTMPGMNHAAMPGMKQGTAAMPGCLSYIIANASAEADALWITEVWDSKESHQASLALPAVRDAIARGRPLIAGFSNRVETTPLGGVGLPRAG